MTGRLADFFRFAWGLLYWNTRKSWFQFRRGRSPCPCQSLSDSGRAYETHCEASLSWDKQIRFQRVCPLLVSTPQGLRCSVNAAEVRPFWGRPLAYYGGSLATVYLGGALLIFVFLRTVGYPVSIVHLVWPGAWHRVGEVRGWFFMERSQRAFAAGRPAEGMLYLNNAYDFDPSNYTVSATLAQKLQISQPARSDEIYRRLVREYPNARDATLQTWFRAVLARGDFIGVQNLALAQVVEDPGHGAVWLRALLFASRRTRDAAPLRELLANPAPAAQRWHPVLEIELLLREKRVGPARTALLRDQPGENAYALFYRVSELITLNEILAAGDLLSRRSADLDDTARATLLLQLYARQQSSASLQRVVSSLLAAPVNVATLNLLSAHLIRHPDAAIFSRIYAKVLQEKLPLSDATLEAYLALYCTAGVVGEWEKMRELATVLRRDGGNESLIGLVDAFFRGQTTQTRVAGLLPALPMPIEVNYALLERYPGQRSAAAPPGKRK